MNTAPGQPGVTSGGWAICLASTVAACALFWATGTYVAVGPLLTMASVILMLFGLHVVYTWFRPDPFIGPVAGGLATMTWAGTIAGMTALAALRTHAPLIDASLARADAALGVDTAAVVAWVAFHPLIGLLLDVAYLSTVPLLFAIFVFLGLTRRQHQMWELCFAFTGSAILCAFASAFVPAIGTFVQHQIPPDILTLLPPGAGRYYLPTFEAYRSGALSIVDLRDLEGVVQFPSFHAAMALMIAFACRSLPRLSGLATGWSSLILISTIPIGGHYFVDILAGAAVWAIFAQPVLARSLYFKPKRVIL